MVICRSSIHQDSSRKEKKCIVRKSNKKRKCNKKTIKKERKEKIIVSRIPFRKYEEILMKKSCRDKHFL